MNYMIKCPPQRKGKVFFQTLLKSFSSDSFLIGRRWTWAIPQLWHELHYTYRSQGMTALLEFLISSWLHHPYIMVFLSLEDVLTLMEYATVCVSPKDTTSSVHAIIASNTAYFCWRHKAGGQRQDKIKNLPSLIFVWILVIQPDTIYICMWVRGQCTMGPL